MDFIGRIVTATLARSESTDHSDERRTHRVRRPLRWPADDSQPGSQPPQRPLSIHPLYLDSVQWRHI